MSWSISASVRTAVPARSWQSRYSRAADASSSPALLQLPPPAQPARAIPRMAQSARAAFMSIRFNLAPTRREAVQDRAFLRDAGRIPAGDLLDRAHAAA